MTDRNISLDDLLQENRRKRKAEELAQEILGKNRRARTPAGTRPNLGASLASRVGVGKRNSSLPRSNTAPPRSGRPPPANRASTRDKSRFNSSFAAASPDGANGNGLGGYGATPAYGGGELSIRGAAGGSYIVVAQNFAPGTTAADIESVMIDVGGQMTDCRLIASNPTVIAEMTFVEKAGADAVINTFNNKKADGRTLYVWMKGRGSSKPKAAHDRPNVEDELEVQAATDETMEVDQNAEAREAENRLREERRSRADRGAKDVFPSGPRAGRGYNEDNYYRGSRGGPAYQDGRSGFDRSQSNRYGGGREPIRDGGRMYSDSMRRGGQSWRP